jgi:hypothetical protein
MRGLVQGDGSIPAGAFVGGPSAMQAALDRMAGLTRTQAGVHRASQ